MYCKLYVELPELHDYLISNGFLDSPIHNLKPTFINFGLMNPDYVFRFCNLDPILTPFGMFVDSSESKMLHEITKQKHTFDMTMDVAGLTVMTLAK
ncbi:hypothetical protein VNO80_22163 [Phaseolus coccineus]|uniref:Uncharacterized protein n=1 Tax=Phaseolus coccineus TaxID=3886 RepID=A0AAN9QTQ9_PHACN